MPHYREAISTSPALLPRQDLASMMRLVRTLYRLSRHPAYRALVLPLVPEIARYNPGHDSVMMGYDFHLTPEGPRLIEVNTNAGGALLAYLAHFPDASLTRAALSERLRRQFLSAFAEEMHRFSRGARSKPQHIAVLDEDPQNQYLYQEMVVFSRLFADWGVRCSIVAPEQLTADGKGVRAAGEPVDFVYNRHCDFFLESPPMAGIRDAYRNGAVCLSPNPFTYGLLADKRRMILWSDRERLDALGLDAAHSALLTRLIPESRLLADLDAGTLWAERQNWVFKPVSRFGSRGVYLGRKISRSRFNELDPRSTLVQRFAPPSSTQAPEEGPTYKTDFRLYVYRARVLGVAARLYQGQVTNLRTAGGGFAPVRVV